MSIQSLWYPLFIVALCLAIGAFIARGSPWYRGLLAQGGSRFEMIDGLRGFLALGVFFTHVMATHGYYARGHWDTTFAPFYVVSGEAGVSLFFMITGFLFWRKAMAAEGKLDTRALYLSRIRRLAPMYFVSVALCLVVIAALSGFTLRESPMAVLREIRPWLSFGFMTTGDVNGVKDAHIINAVYWTLAYEWAFYLALPLLALFARGWKFGLLAAIAIFFGIQAPITLNFLAGALAAMFVERRFLLGRLASPYLALVPLLAIGTVLSMDSAYSPAAIALMFVFFLFVVDGNSILGLLRNRAAHFLGTVSYSFYLLHAAVIFIAFRVADFFVPVATLGSTQHWLIAALAAAVALVISAVTYRRVEYPFLTMKPAVPAVDLDLLHSRAPVS
jgi:peptidoglycan/LPS O-acetylase OafA/YrhL